MFSNLQFNEAARREGYKNTKSSVKYCDHWEKRKTRCHTNCIYNLAAPVIDFTDEPVVQCDRKIVKKWFCRWLQITEMAQVIYNIYKWLQIIFAVNILNVLLQVLILCTVWAS